MSNENPTTSTLPLVSIFFVALAVSILLAATQAISPIVTWNVMAICIFAIAIGFVMLVLFQKSGMRDPTSPEVVASFPDPMSANVIVGLLENGGINATATGSYTSGFQTEIASDVEVVVAFKDADAARELLANSNEVDETATR